ncbi:MAG: DUF4292 domain-containing protein [Sphingobacteriales bacterium]|nr:MAG: DUF4292 domain-containing protein [Sphingobacteriales bacterium]
MRKYLLYCIISIAIISCNTAKKTTKSKQADSSITTTQKNSDTTKTTKPTTPTTTQPTEKPIDAKIQKILDAIASNELQFTNFYSKIKTKATIDQKKQSFTTQLRWLKNKKMWMSMSIIGIEGARVLINKDSIQIIDRLNQRNILKPISYIQKKAYINLTYKDIEKVFLAQPILFNKQKLELSETTTENILKSNDERFNTIITLDKQNNVKSIFITDKLKNQTLLSEYSDHTLLNGKQFPKERYIKIINGPEIFELNMTFDDIDLAKSLTFPFEPNPKYSNE